MNKTNIYERIEGLLLGTAVGDAIGLPREGLSKKRADRMFGPAPLRHRFFFGKGMISDDTEHACMIARALLASQGDVDRFTKSLAWRLRFWLLGVPAGVGFATLKGILKLWLGFPPHKSGVHSAGNGPAMRCGLIGLYTKDINSLKKLVQASTRVTHTDIRAYEDALIIALACQYACLRNVSDINPNELFNTLNEHITNEELLVALLKVKTALENYQTEDDFSTQIRQVKGISGYIIHTVAVSLFCWLKNKEDFRATVEEVILLGGDTDTTGAITGVLAGASLGSSAIPQDWIDGIMEWPRSISWMQTLSKHLADHVSGRNPKNSKPVSLFWPGVVIRNIFFTTIVLLHGLRRIFPPYV